jgi:UDP-glucose 4-epimerase
MSVASIENQTFYINGRNYNTYDGTCVRDYIHVVDVCNALILAANKLYNEPPGTYDAFNVCSGERTSNRQLVDLFSTIYKIKSEYKDVRPGDPGYLIGDPTKLETKLRFKRKYDLIDIIHSHYEYTRKCL